MRVLVCTSSLDCDVITEGTDVAVLVVDVAWTGAGRELEACEEAATARWGTSVTGVDEQLDVATVVWTDGATTALGSLWRSGARTSGPCLVAHREFLTDDGALARSPTPYFTWYSWCCAHCEPWGQCWYSSAWSLLSRSCPPLFL